jgi:hypothetical protein
VRLLLDTHTMYWYVEDHPQLSWRARTLIQDAANEIFISPASYCEVAIKISLGKWRLNRPYCSFYPRNMGNDNAAGWWASHMSEQWGRTWITIDTSRVALALARTRLVASRYPYYYLADNCPQMTQMSADEDITNYLRQSASSADGKSSSSGSIPDVRKGFVYKRVPHVTLELIANNPDIKEGMTRAEIDEAQWSTLYSTKSCPFEPPSSGKIAVKVINHYGDEVLKVYPLQGR